MRRCLPAFCGHGRKCLLQRRGNFFCMFHIVFIQKPQYTSMNVHFIDLNTMNMSKWEGILYRKSKKLVVKLCQRLLTYIWGSCIGVIGENLFTLNKCCVVFKSIVIDVWMFHFSACSYWDHNNIPSLITSPNFNILSWNNFYWID